MLLALSDIPLRSTSFTLEDRCLLWARARLYADRITLFGWGLWGRYWRNIPLGKIKQIDHDNRRLILWLEKGREVSFFLRRAGHWADAIRAHRAVRENSKGTESDREL